MSYNIPIVIKLSWELEPTYQTWESQVQIFDPNFTANKGELGHHQISIIPQRYSMDRGKYLVMIGTIGGFGLDEQEGFPRYYFELETAKREMELWVNCREECLNANRIQNENCSQIRQT